MSLELYRYSNESLLRHPSVIFPPLGFSRTDVAEGHRQMQRVHPIGESCVRFDVCPSDRVSEHLSASVRREMRRQGTQTCRS